MMTYNKIDIHWSPFADRFITFGNDLKLFQCESIKDSQKYFGGIKLSETSYAQVIATNTDVQFVKCVSCNPKSIHSDSDVLLAVGQTSGKVLLTSFHYNPDNASLVGREFIPKHARQCNCLDWNTIDTNLLSAGFDKSRNDYATLVWDVQRSPNQNSEVVQSYSQKPLYEIGLGDLTHSLKWFPYQNQVIVCGMNNKHLKIYDLRDSGKPKATITRGVYGIALDPYYDNRFASFHENIIFVWDIRNIEKPVTTIGPEPRNIMKVEWCPTRSNMLASLIKDGSGIKLFDIKDYVNANNDLEPAIIDRVINPFERSNNNTITSFTWHPSHESRMIVVTPTGSLRDFTVVDRITLNWSPVSEIIWTHGKKILQCIDSRDRAYENIDDIAVRMRNLALGGYGLSNDKLWQMFASDSDLFHVWKWIESRIISEDKSVSIFSKQSSITSKEDLFNSHNPERLYGVRPVLMQISISQTELTNKSDVILCPNNNESSGNHITNHIIKKYYKSNDRKRALQHCGWDSNFDDDSQNYQLIKSLQNDGKYSRSAAVQIFGGGKIKKAINILKIAAEGEKDKATNINLSAIALALSGYTKDTNSLWREMCQSIKSQLSDPYLRAIFSFLTNDTEDYSEILYEDKLDLSDRIAFACIYLPDSALCEYLNYLNHQMIETGNLRGILLTGITNEGLDLFARYIEATSDVQTISLLLLRALPSPLSQSTRAKMWIDSYRQLLDCWRLWNIRAQFDIEWYKALYHLEEPKQQIFVSCNYCGLPISSYISRSRTVKAQETYQQQLSHHQYNRSSSTHCNNKARIQSCPTCRKPLPRCALCLTQLGTPAGSYWRPGLNFNKNERKLSQFSSWFTWCQTCRHGGHASHIIEWFTDHVECPVAGCACKCMSLDANAKLSTNTTI